MSLNWYALKTWPIHRIEFTVMHYINQLEHPAMVPYEIKHVRKPLSKHTVERKYPSFPTYVFVGLRSYADYLHIRDSINNREPDLLRYKRPLVRGLVSFNGRPAKLTAEDVKCLAEMSRGAKPTAVNLHKAFQVGGKARVLDGPFRGFEATVDSVSKKRITVMLAMFNRTDMAVEFEPGALEAA